ncbi:MAG: DUF6544 family protein [Gemmatimonadaceae bacterium]
MCRSARPRHHAVPRGRKSAREWHGETSLRGARYFAEMAWYPTALLPGQGVRWEAVDERSANATLVDGPISLTLLFRFDDARLIKSVHADARGATQGKDGALVYEFTP